MSFKGDLQSYLIDDPGINGVVDNRVFPLFAPTTAQRPYITYTKIASNGIHHLEAVGSASALVSESIAFDIWSESAIVAENISQILREALDGYSGLMNGVTDVRRVFLDSMLDLIENPTDGSQVPEFHQNSVYDFWYNRSVPTF